MSSRPKSLVFLASGEGQLFETVCSVLLEKLDTVEVKGLVTQNPKAGCVQRANRLNIPVTVVEGKTEDFDRRLSEAILALKPDYIVLTGFTRKIPKDVVQSFPNRIVNSHPSLLPKYGGKGMYGRRVHEAVYKARDVVTGISVHLVSLEYDEGPLLAQKEVPLPAGISAEQIEQKVKEEERRFLPQVLLKWLGGV